MKKYCMIVVLLCALCFVTGCNKDEETAEQKIMKLEESAVQAVDEYNEDVKELESNAKVIEENMDEFAE